MIQIPDGYEQCEWKSATHVLSNGQVLWVSKEGNYMYLGHGFYFYPAGLDELNIIPLRKLPELDLSPLTEEEFYQLRPGDTFTCPGSPTIWKIDDMKVISENVTWFRNEARHMTPTEATARRLRGEGKQ
jgi:hypothetical protein